MKQVAAAYLQLLNYLKYLSGAVIVGVFLLIVSDVFVRLVGKQPWLYSSVLAEYGLLWFTMLAAPWLARNKAHVFIDALRQFLSEPLQRIVAKFVYLSCTLVSLVVCYYSFDLLWVAIREGEIDTRAVDMPKWMLLAPIPPCFFLLAIEFGRFLLGFDSMYGSRTDVKEVA